MNECWFFLKQLDTTKTTNYDMEVADISISFTRSDCTTGTSSCISAVSVTAFIKGKSTIVEIIVKGNDTTPDDYYVTVNGESLPDPTLEPFYNGHIYVKRISNLFMMVKGTDFQVLFDKNGRLYVTLQPFLTNKVRQL